MSCSVNERRFGIGPVHIPEAAVHNDERRIDRLCHSKHIKAGVVYTQSRNIFQRTGHTAHNRNHHGDQGKPVNKLTASELVLGADIGTAAG